MIGLTVEAWENRAAVGSYIAKYHLTYPNFIMPNKFMELSFKKVTGKPFKASPVFLYFKPDGSYAGQQLGKLNYKKLNELVSKNQ